jgi:hypothetical protein
MKTYQNSFSVSKLWHSNHVQQYIKSVMQKKFQTTSVRVVGFLIALYSEISTLVQLWYVSTYREIFLCE